MKDPAVLFYFQDFLVGTEFMTDEEIGKYMRVLCHLADKGSLNKSQILRICKTNIIPEAINEKLLIDEDGKYYQKRMKIEQEKRAKHIEHQRENANKRWKKDECDGNAMAMPLLNENENINRDINEDKNIIKREIKFKSEVFEFTDKYSDVMLDKFCNYWTEKNKSGRKMRYEMEKVFEISKRLATWSSKDKEFNKTTNLRVLNEILNNGKR